MRNEGLKLHEIAARLNQRDRDDEPESVDQAAALKPT
jgi:hypothetical protein